MTGPFPAHPFDIPLRAVLASPDPRTDLSQFVEVDGLEGEDLFWCYLKSAKYFLDVKQDALTAIDYLGQAKEILYRIPSVPSAGMHAAIVAFYLSLKQPVEALEVYVNAASLIPGDCFASSHIQLANALKVLRSPFDSDRGHGHELLLKGLSRLLEANQLRTGELPLVVLEIGTTREDVAGQGSTRKIAEFCINNGLGFVTVDIDEFNTRCAFK